MSATDPRPVPGPTPVLPLPPAAGPALHADALPHAGWGLEARLSHLRPNSRGIVLVIVSLVAFTLLDATAKALIARYPVAQVVWWRQAGQFLLLLLIFNRRLPQLMRTRLFGMHVLRAVAQAGAALLFFLGLTRIGLVEATAIMDVNPVLITLGAALFFGERLGPRRILGVLAALIGSLIIIRPGSAVFTPYAIYPLLAACCYATFALATRRVGQRESPFTAMIWSSLIASLLMGLAVPQVWVTPAAGDLPLFLVLAAMGTAGQFFMIRAFSVAEASAIAPFGYVGLIFAAVWGFVFFGEIPDLWTGVGALIIVAAGLYVWYRETQLVSRKRLG